MAGRGGLKNSVRYLSSQNSLLHTRRAADASHPAALGVAGGWTEHLEHLVHLVLSPDAPRRRRRRTGGYRPRRAAQCHGSTERAVRSPRSAAAAAAAAVLAAEGEFLKALSREEGRQALAHLHGRGELHDLRHAARHSPARRAATVVMENVLVQNNEEFNGGLLCIDRGSVTGTNVTFRNGSTSSYGGCVWNGGSFACTDCIFEKCHAGYKGAVGAGWVRAASCFSRFAWIPAPPRPAPACRPAEGWSAAAP